MASTYETLLRFELMADGEKVNLWGQVSNTQLELIAESVHGMEIIALASTTPYTLTASNGISDESRNAILKFTGVLTADIEVVVPNQSHLYRVWNATTGAFNVTIKTSAGTGVKVDRNKLKAVVCDGTNVYDASTELARRVLSGKTAGFTVDFREDSGKIFNCTANSFTVALPPAASAASGFPVTVVNSSSTATDLVTIDADAAELIDGELTIALRPGESANLVCDGTGWKIVSIYQKTKSFTVTVSTTLTLAHKDAVIFVNSASNLVITLPQDSTTDLPDGFSAIIVRQGAGGVSFAVEGTDTLYSDGTQISSQKTAATVYKQTSGNWWAFGSLT